MSSQFRLDPDYKTVPQRIADFKEKHPEGCLRPVDAENPYRIQPMGEKIYVVYVAAAYRTPDDPMPGIGVAWEIWPGPTPYTADSELMNAETSAWGRAIVATLASESKSVASAEDMDRSADRPSPPDPGPTKEMRDSMAGLVSIIALAPGDEQPELKQYIRDTFGGPEDMTLENIKEASKIAAGWPSTKTAGPVATEPSEGAPF